VTFHLNGSGGVVRRRSRTCVWLLALLVVAAGLRLYGLEWDGLAGAHPDERYLTGVADGLAWPDRMNPLAVAPDLAYGHLPVYLLGLLLIPFQGVDPLLVGRGLAALFDLATVSLVFVLGRRVCGPRAGLLAAGLCATMPLHVQQAHFFTSDAPLASLAIATLLLATRVAGRGRGRDAWLAGAFLGLAVGAKVIAALLAIPLCVACVVMPGSRGARMRRCLQAGGAAMLAFGLTNPFAVLGFSSFWRNVAREAAIARGLLDVPYTRQFHGTWAYVYPVVQQARWGMGCTLALAAFGGMGYAVFRAMRKPPTRSEWVLLAWVIPTFACTGALHARYPRYLLPLSPVLALYAARLLDSLARRWGGGRNRLALALLAGVTLCGPLARSVALVGSYPLSHPWQAASEWFAERVPQGAVVAVEAWDHPLPLPVAGEYDLRELPVFGEDTPGKWAEIGSVLEEAEYVVLASRRSYGALARWPDRFPLTTRYYERLFGGDLGFEPIACFGRPPRLGPVALVDDPAAGLEFTLPEMCRPGVPLVLNLGRLDESFVVYDRPTVIVFGRY
jgi:hypothetical protein